MELSNIGKHCIWADRKIIELLSSVSTEDFIQVPQHTGRSLHTLVAHILASYEFALGNDYKNATLKYESMNKSQLLDSWTNQVRKFVTELESDPSKYFYL